MLGDCVIDHHIVVITSYDPQVLLGKYGINHHILGNLLDSTIALYGMKLDVYLFSNILRRISSK